MDPAKRSSELLFISDNTMLFNLLFLPTAESLGMGARMVSVNQLDKYLSAIETIPAVTVLELEANTDLMIFKNEALLNLVKNTNMVVLANEVNRARATAFLSLGVLSIVLTTTKPQAFLPILQLAILSEPYVPRDLFMVGTVDFKDGRPDFLASSDGATRRHLEAMTQPSRREVDVLMLIAEGKTTKEIASALYIAEPTVKMHTSKLMRHFRVNNRTKLCLVAQDYFRKF